MPAAMYAPHIPPNRHSGVAMGMVAGTTMAMSAGEPRSRGLVPSLVPGVWLHTLLSASSGTLLTSPSPAPVAPHQVTVPTYRPPGTPSYSYVPPQW